MNQEKICVVTGGANGIGRCIVDTFLTAGYSIAVIDKSISDHAKEKQSTLPQNYFFHSGDIADEKELELFAHKVIDKFGHVDCLVNNACISRRGILSGCSYDDFNYVLRVGITAPYYLAKLFMPNLAPKASIVNISSTRAAMSQADTESYTAAKGGISALTHSLCISLCGKVRVNSISPGWIDTTESEFSKQDHTQHPSGRVGRPQDIAQMALYLCSDKAEFINGENITIDGGMTRQMIYHDDHGWTFSGE